MNTNNYIIIMAGGIGSRFWPYSRYAFPKQFLDVLGVGKTLIQLTYHRFATICPKENIYIVSNDRYEGLIREQLPDLEDFQILLEPDRRNTAPCIAYASYKIKQKNPDAVLVVTPSDQAVFMEDTFIKVINTAIASANDHNLLTIGIKPSRPETGYGYIQFHEETEGEVKKVKTFTEKPNLELAQTFFESGEFVWNAGIFIWKVSAITEAFEKYLPEIAETFDSLHDAYYTENEAAKIEWAYARTKGISIDFGVMEKADNVYVIPAEFGWSDVGSWSSLHEIQKKDENQNVVDANALVYDSNNCIIKGSKDKLIVVQGLQDYLVADCGNVLLICKKDDEKQFRAFGTDVKNEKGEKYL